MHAPASLAVRHQDDGAAAPKTGATTLSAPPPTSPSAAPAPTRRGTSTSSAFNLIISAAGAGLLSYPYAASQQGWLLCFAMTLFFAAGNVYTLRILIAFTMLYGRRLRAHSYEETVGAVLGPRGWSVASATIVLGVLGALTGFLIVMGDLGEVSLRHWAGPDTWWASRAPITVFFATTVVFPLSLVRDMHDLKGSSALSIASVLAVALVLVYTGAVAISDGHDSADPVAVKPSVTILLGVPISVFSLGCHSQICCVTGEADAATTARMGTVVAFSTAACVVLYCVTGVFGYLLYGNATQGDVFNNMTSDDVSTAVAKGLMALHIALASPVQLFVYQRSMALYRLARGLQRPTRGHMVVQSLVMVGLTTALAIRLPQIAVVFGLVGATLSTTQIYTIPGLMLLAVARGWAGVAGGDGSNGGSAGATAGVRAVDYESLNGADVGLIAAAAAVSGPGGTGMKADGPTASLPLPARSRVVGTPSGAGTADADAESDAGGASSVPSAHDPLLQRPAPATTGAVGATLPAARLPPPPSPVVERPPPGSRAHFGVAAAAPASPPTGHPAWYGRGASASSGVAVPEYALVEPVPPSLTRWCCVRAARRSRQGLIGDGLAEGEASWRDGRLFHVVPRASPNASGVHAPSGGGIEWVCEPTSPDAAWWAAAQGMALVAMGVTLSVLTTAVIVYEDFLKPAS